MALKPPVNNDLDHIQGPLDAPIEFVEYGDYECPYCGRAYYVIKELQAKLGDKMKFVFRNFPLFDAHPHALNAAIASEIANKFAKFWPMHDILFENQKQLDDQHLQMYAEKIGIAKDQFIAEFNEQKKYLNGIENHLESGLRSGVNGTPSIFINGKKYDGNPYSLEDLLDATNL